MSERPPLPAPADCSSRTQFSKARWYPMRVTALSAVVPGLVALCLSGCESQADSQETTQTEAHAEGHGESEHPQHLILLTSVLKKDVVSTQQYVCQIHSCQHIEVKALEGGYLEKICVKEGQQVEKGKLMFKILPTLYQARLDSELAEVQRMQIAADNAALVTEAFLQSWPGA